jgi:hypothetical protein
VYFWPSEHGAWIWWIGPFLIGVAAGGRPNLNLFLLFVAALAAFLLRQPATIAVKAHSGRRPAAELTPALFWMLAYGLVAGLAAGALVLSGFSRLLWLGVPGIVVFAWHLILVSRRDERGQTGVQLVAAGVLALAAPAAYEVSGGVQPVQPWILWGLTWFQSAASIVFIALRLEQRHLKALPGMRARWAQAWRAVTYSSFNLLATALLAVFALVPVLVPVAFGPMLIDVLEGAVHPPAGAKPATIGIRQLLASTAFVVVTSIGYLVG